MEQIATIIQAEGDYNMRNPIKYQFFLLVTACLLMFSGCPLSAETTNKNAASDQNRSNNENLNMNQDNLTAVEISSWGGKEIGLQVKENSVSVRYVCADGEIPGKLMVNANGEFSADGYHVRLRPGPTRVDGQTEKQPARFQGAISGNTMKLKVSLKETGEQIADFTLEKNKDPQIHRCQ